MTTFLVGTDGSDLSIRAAVEGLSLTRPPDKVLLVTVALGCLIVQVFSPVCVWRVRLARSPLTEIADVVLTAGSREVGFRLLAVTELSDATGGNARDKDR